MAPFNLPEYIIVHFPIGGGGGHSTEKDNAAM